MRSDAVVMFLIACTIGMIVSGQVRREPEQLHMVLPRDAIPSIDEPAFEPASKAKLSNREPVLGIVGEHEQRAYSTWQLDRHEIVNDVLEGTPITVTW
jgi:Protein of unknown function (DUF3179)